MSVIKAGTYRFNDELTVPKNNELDENGKFVVNMPFETTVYIDAYEEEIGIINSKVVCSGMIVSPYILEETACVDVTYVIQSLIPDVVLGDESLNSVCPFTLWVYNGEPWGYTSEKWNKEATSFQTITITSDTEVDEDFYEMWFAPNTKPVADEEKPIFDVIAEKLALIAENEQKVYDAGYAEGEASGGSDFPVEEYFAKTVTELTLTGVTKLGVYSLYQHNALEALYLPDVTAIDGSAIYSCSKLSTVVMGEGLITIGSNGFSVIASCPNITSLEIPSTVETINFNAFTGCTGLISVTFLGTPKEIGTVISRTIFPATLQFINVPWLEGEVPGFPWGATGLVNINYGYTKEE